GQGPERAAAAQGGEALEKERQTEVREHLGSGDESIGDRQRPQRDEARSEARPQSFAARGSKEKRRRGSGEQSAENDQPRLLSGSASGAEQDFREPLVIDPGFSGDRTGPGVPKRKGASAQDVTSRLQMPPDVGIGRGRERGDGKGGHADEEGEK